MMDKDKHLQVGRARGAKGRILRRLDGCLSADSAPPCDLDGLETHDGKGRSCKNCGANFPYVDMDFGSRKKDIMRRRDEGKTFLQIASKFGITVARVKQIVKPRKRRSRARRVQ